MDPKMEIDFSTFVMSLASAAYCSMGLCPNPVTKKVEKNLVSAKQQISLLEMLKEKTKNNLTKDEEGTLESMLYQLHMMYVKCVETDKMEGKKDGEKNS
jgi:Domain of unknown function (DUF1844)